MGNQKLNTYCFVMPWHVSQGIGGGSEVQAMLLASTLARRQYDVHYICQSRMTEKANSSEIIDGVQVHWLPNRSGKFQMFHMRMYLKTLKKVNPDFVVQRMTSCVTGILGWYAHKYSKKFIWFSTDMDTVNPKMHFTRQRNFYKTTKTSLLSRLSLSVIAWINDRIRNMGMRYIYRGICQNSFQQSELKKNFNLEAIILKSGHHTPVQEGKRLANKTVLWAGNLGSNKNPIAFLEIAKKLSEKKWKFIVIGKGDDKPQIKELLSSGTKNLKYEGNKTFSESLEYFNRASILVNTSFKEGFPNTFIQAWLRGIPVVTLGVDPDNIISEKKLGVVCETTNEAAVSINQLLEEDSYYSLISKKAKEYSLANHAIDQIATQFINILLS